jgi:ATP-dependent metalloprotease
MLVRVLPRSRGVLCRRGRQFSWFRLNRASSEVPPDRDRISKFLNHLETSKQISKSEVYNEVLLISQEQKTRELELKLENNKQGPSSKNAASTMLRLAGMLVSAGLVLYFLRKVDLTRGIGGDSDLFKDNFQEFHPRSKLPRTIATKIGPDGAAKPVDEEVINILWGKKPVTGSGQNPNIHFDSVLFKDVMGNYDAKEELSDIADYLRHPEKYENMGLKIPKGVLLSGPPGTGKTLLARALAGEAEVPFINVNGSSFVQMFAGLGAQRVRRLFARARELAPCIVFIDEIDALGTRRDQPQNYSRQTLNQLLGEMDGFSSNPGVIVVGATNLAHTLDTALTRPGRFDRTVELSLPDRTIRKQILAHYLKRNGTEGLDLDLMAANTTGFSGAELFNMVNRAGIEAVKKNQPRITQPMLMESQETLLMGRASRDTIMSPQTKQVTAYHEAGHALVSLYTKAANPIYKATILPRGSALGFVAHNRKDEHLLSKEALLAQLDVCMGGRAAEELIFGPDHVTQGASSDFQQATSTARSMVARFGMSSEIGKVFLEDEMIKRDSVVSQEVKKLTDSAYERATRLLKSKATQHKMIAEALLKEETLSADQIKKLIGFKDEDVLS